MLNRNQTFHKSERLTGEVQVEKLYEKGQGFIAFPYRVVYLAEGDENPTAKVLISAPKKRFKHAVDRNHIKRLTREAYRKNKESLYNALQEKRLSLNFALNYVGNEMISYAQTEEKMKEIINKLIEKI